jgi:hypothetical protein
VSTSLAQASRSRLSLGLLVLLISRPFGPVLAKPVPGRGVPSGLVGLVGRTPTRDARL